MTQFVVPALAAGRRPYNYLTAMRLFRRPQLRRSVMPCRREALVSDPTREFFFGSPLDRQWWRSTSTIAFNRKELGGPHDNVCHVDQ
jgi:hypothetical protein